MRDFSCLSTIELEELLNYVKTEISLTKGNIGLTWMPLLFVDIELLEHLQINSNVDNTTLIPLLEEALSKIESELFERSVLI